MITCCQLVSAHHFHVFSLSISIAMRLMCTCTPNWIWICNFVYLCIKWRVRGSIVPSNSLHFTINKTSPKKIHRNWVSTFKWQTYIIFFTWINLILFRYISRLRYTYYVQITFCFRLNFQWKEYSRTNTCTHRSEMVRNRFKKRSSIADRAKMALSWCVLIPVQIRLVFKSIEIEPESNYSTKKGSFRFNFLWINVFRTCFWTFPVLWV